MIVEFILVELDDEGDPVSGPRQRNPVHIALLPTHIVAVTPDEIEPSWTWIHTTEHDAIPWLVEHPYNYVKNVWYYALEEHYKRH